MNKRLFMAVLLALVGLLPATADRYSSLITAKYLMLTTTRGTTYYYIVSSESSTLLQLRGDDIVLGRDTFARSEVKSLRMKTIERFLLDEDSLRYGNDYTMEHGLLALRRTLAVGLWNSIVLPVALTGEQVRQTFGDDAQLATVRGIRDGEQAVVEFQTISLDTDDVVMQASQHYILRPTRQPDLPEGRTAIAFGNVRPKGPLYLLPNVTLKPKQSPQTVSVHNSDRSTVVGLRGTYTRRDGSSVLNRKIAPGAYALGDNGLVSQHADSLLVKAFSSWFVDNSAEKRLLQFYIDGISEDLSAILLPQADMAGNTPARDGVFDMQGRRLDVRHREGLKPGIYIIDGKKHIIK